MEKYFIWLIAVSCFASCKSKTADYDGYIEFSHVGSSDKPITSILFIKEGLPTFGKEDLTFKDVLIVDVNTFDNLFNYLTNGHTEVKCIDTWHKYGSFKIEITKKNKNYFCYFIEGRQQSLIFFQGLLEYLKEQDTAKNVQETIKRDIFDRIKNPPPIGSQLE